MKKFNINTLPITVNSKEKINVLYLECKSEKNMLYIIENDNENIDLELFKKMEFTENIQILPKKKANELNLSIDHNNKVYTILINKKPLYTLKNNKNIILNNQICKLILSNGSLYASLHAPLHVSNNADDPIIEDKKEDSITKYDNDIVNSILKKDIKLNEQKENITNLEENEINNTKIIIENKIDISEEVLVKKHYNIIKIDTDVSESIAENNNIEIKTNNVDLVSSDLEKPNTELSYSSEFSESVTGKDLSEINNDKDLNDSIYGKSAETYSVSEFVEISSEIGANESKTPFIESTTLKTTENNIITQLDDKSNISKEYSIPQNNEISNTHIDQVNIVIPETIENMNLIQEKDILKSKSIEEINNNEMLEIKKNEIDSEIFNLENILEDFNKLFKFIENKDENKEIKATTVDRENMINLLKINEATKEQMIQTNSANNTLEKNSVESLASQNKIIPVSSINTIPEKKLLEPVTVIRTNDHIIPQYKNIKILYQNSMYKVNVYKLEHTDNLNYANLFKTNISKNNIINNTNISFELKSENASYLINFFNEKYLINKVTNTIVLTNLLNKKSQIIKNGDNFKLGNNDYILYNDATVIIFAMNKQIFDNNYGTSYNLYIPK
jgi:hypothetical protein